MERVRRLTNLWAYLPAFRAVAETQHLPTASKLLHLSPSALSRSIKLLEDEVGVPLFDRVGRSIELNASGQRFLSAVRDAMRLVDEGLNHVTERRLSGAVRVSAPAPWRTEIVAPTLDALRAAHPELVPVITETEPDAATGALLRGRLDVALVHAFTPHEDLTARELAALPCGLYCGPGNALYGQEAAVHEGVEQAAADRPEEDPWPSHLPRKVGLRADLGSRLALCAAGRYVAALPEALAERDAGLWRVEGPQLRPLPVYGVTRRSLGIPGRADAVLEALAEALAGVR